MKKILSLILVAIMLASSVSLIASCGEEEGGGTTVATTTNSGTVTTPPAGGTTVPPTTVTTEEPTDGETLPKLENKDLDAIFDKITPPSITAVSTEDEIKAGKFNYNPVLAIKFRISPDNSLLPYLFDLSTGVAPKYIGALINQDLEWYITIEGYGKKEVALKNLDETKYTFIGGTTYMATANIDLAYAGFNLPIEVKEYTMKVEIKDPSSGSDFFIDNVKATYSPKVPTMDAARAAMTNLAYYAGAYTLESSAATNVNEGADRLFDRDVRTKMYYQFGTAADGNTVDTKLSVVFSVADSITVKGISIFTGLDQVSFGRMPNKITLYGMSDANDSNPVTIATLTDALPTNEAITTSGQTTSLNATELFFPITGANAYKYYKVVFETPVIAATGDSKAYNDALQVSMIWLSVNKPAA